MTPADSVVLVVGVAKVEREKHTPGALVCRPCSLLAPQPAPASNCDHTKAVVNTDNKSQRLFTFQQQRLAVYFCRQKQGTLGSHG